MSGCPSWGFVVRGCSHHRGSPVHGSSMCSLYRQRAELDDLRRQLEENSSLAGRALREELDKTREEQERRHQVRSSDSAETC